MKSKFSRMKKIDFHNFIVITRIRPFLDKTYFCRKHVFSYNFFTKKIFFEFNITRFLKSSNFREFKNHGHLIRKIIDHTKKNREDKKVRFRTIRFGGLHLNVD